MYNENVRKQKDMRYIKHDKEKTSKKSKQTSKQTDKDNFYSGQLRS